MRNEAIPWILQLVRQFAAGYIDFASSFLVGWRALVDDQDVVGFDTATPVVLATKGSVGAKEVTISSRTLS